MTEQEFLFDSFFLSLQWINDLIFRRIRSMLQTDRRNVDEMHRSHLGCP